ncbi:hypothetical protein SOASR030_37020 [Leminorella grimontii]|uniref:Cytochrome c-type biogenesis protein H TPR domain-containing protein n=1 Tax=Leminorella grimontii TaxID=82981 RepID=A0AAV5N7J9_9GAMM|nr:c-type cytochrome biogenesis protein CcmI [Leminorella grimontii]KFC94253.1 NrfG family cytochrome c-type heme lyase subunit [Leminorella grimontii ATCC 33999 = DSM 5078]GKX57590.1 hypothetical protein SOASR030_37020 [Leminorella grimontii]VFS54685.1 Formate-dependent nitrite reductase complex subunit nrfG [Leminorella grimontii]
MTAFWIGSGILALLAIAIVWLPFCRAGKAPPQTLREQVNVALYRQESALAERLFGCEESERRQAEALKEELALSLLQNAQDAPASAMDGKRSTLLTPVLMTVFTLVLTIGGYVAYGQYSSSAEFVRQGGNALFEGMSEEQMQDKVVAELMQRIRTSPNDSESWFLLGQRYLNSNAFENALVAFDRVAKIRGDDAEVLTAKATTLYYQAGQRMTPQAELLIQRALALDPNQITALMLLASDRFLNAQYQQAIDIWQRLLDSEDPRVDRARLIEAINMARMMK